MPSGESFMASVPKYLSPYVNTLPFLRQSYDEML